MEQANPGIALITGASSLIGARYAERLARRGYDLILVASSGVRLLELAACLQAETSAIVRVIGADISDAGDLARIEALLREDCRISMLVNNAGIGASRQAPESDIDRMQRMIGLNVTALTRLNHAAAPGFAARGAGTIVNIAPAVALAPERLNGVLGASKAYVLALSISLHHELAGKGVRMQTVLPGAGAADLWRDAGMPAETLPKDIAMRAERMVDAALAGLDRGELVTTTAPEDGKHKADEAARLLMRGSSSSAAPASAYRSTETL